MQAVGRRYVAHFNRRYSRRGTLWEGRYRATVIEGRTLFPAGEPRRRDVAGAWATGEHGGKIIAGRAYRHHIGLTLDSLITDHPLYWSLGNTPFERQRAYRELCEQPLDEREASQLQQATLKGWVLGSESYREWAARAANRRVSPLPRGRPRKVRETPANAIKTFCFKDLAKERHRRMPFSFRCFRYGTNKNIDPCTNLIIGDRSSRFVCYSIDSSRIFRVPACRTRLASCPPARLQRELPAIRNWF